MDLNPFRKKKKAHTSITVDAEVLAEVKKICKREKVTVSRIVEELLKELIKKYIKEA